MPFAYAGAAAGLASSVNGLVGGTGQPTPYQFQNSGQADNQFGSTQNILSGYANALPAQTVPQYQQIEQNLYNNPYAGLMQQGAQSAANYGSNTLAPQQQQGAAALSGAAQGELPYASQMLQTGFDPQNALYQRTLQQTQDQTGAALANSGVAQTPYGQGIMGQTLGNFNIDWQNNELARQQSAASGAGSIIGSAGTGLSGASALGGSALGTLSGASALPYNSAQTIGQNQFGALGGLTSGVGGSLAPAQSVNAQNLSYLGAGTGAGSAGSNAWSQGIQGNSQLGQGFGSALGQLGNLFGSGNSSGLGSLAGMLA